MYLVYSKFSIIHKRPLINHIGYLLTFSLVPTPSVPLARRGSLKPAAFKSKRPAKPPRSTSQPNEEEINYRLHCNRLNMDIQTISS